jgi:glutamyl-Q tRNA(Asp) synthetase
MSYRGRFAPSATGPLHLGSIFAALISFLDARFHQGTWLVRIDDLDTFRCKPEFADSILETLNAFALIPDQAPVFQSTRIDAYHEALHTCIAQQRIYSCTCRRNDLPRGPYPGYCRNRLGQTLLPDTALRIDTQGLATGYTDHYLGTVEPEHPGDFIIKRRDGLIAYQLASAVDESLDQITHVIRGLDLLNSTTMQQWVRTCLDQPPIMYGHFPTIHGADGSKLSKQTCADAVDPHCPGATYSVIAQLLGCNQYPAPDAPADAWIHYFQTLGDPRQFVPKTPHLLADAQAE